MGCGRVLGREFMELSHIMPRRDGDANHKLNRILLTLSGLVRANKQAGWIKIAVLVESMQVGARVRAEQVRDESGG